MTSPNSVERETRLMMCLPVVEDGVPIGILTTTDLVMSFQCALHALLKVAEEIRAPAESAAAPQQANRAEPEEELLETAP